jgi:hypothetical protein
MCWVRLEKFANYGNVGIFGGFVGRWMHEAKK